ncbi:MAG: hypothetical protein RQ763_05130 [Sulfurimonas sp.]|uniref:hypothetical protein n=1 Tax=Sulfurimonas sp. TaxID=2022749 RepID=UPI0028CFAE54|nr:hypothetical protein [Sulfurimonas sp.]MDT8338562.1 hypothetical protein [Sulfurimonas sp.]
MMKQNSMTHGEAWFLEKEVNEDIPVASNTYYKAIYGLPERMSRAEAVTYYNSKLFPYWKELLNIKEDYKNKALALMMFGTLDATKFKLKKELVAEIEESIK